MLSSDNTNEERQSLHGNWSSRLAFIMAVTGSAVGLGNIWKFPYMAGQNGGGAFVLVYLLFVFLIGMPVMMSEILIGRRGRRNPVATMALLGEEEGGSKHWKWVGALGVITAMLILSYYSVIAGWTLTYIPKALSGQFAGADAASIANLFDNFVSNPMAVIAAHTIFMFLNFFVIARGVKGLETAVKFLMPALLFLLFILFYYSLTSGSFAEGVSFMFTPNFAALDWDGVLTAMGLACFTLSIGMGAIMAYGAYLPQETSITSAAVSVVVADTGIAVLSGLVIFPLVFANGLNPGEGPDLVFKTLPLVFGQMQAGTFLATIFFVLLAFAALTSALGLMEPAVAWMVESTKYSRKESSAIIAGLIWLFGLGTALSDNVLSEFKFFQGTIYENVDFITSNIMLPVSAVLITVFAAWVMSKNSTSEELDGHGLVYKMWQLLARYFAPIAILIIFLQAIGWI
ncbi:MAG: sodium-dependent transporter [Woeseiaceae bacterium]|jgi:NSS family neurotransmitter:Na+ symporter|nr:sodium-dependent transporter [Woeseiaceae bacterium]|tara:strand:+ start:815 stop:2188 length:1374 start_codon:yes stop_codon:yes gene_type:complete